MFNFENTELLEAAHKLHSQLEPSWVTIYKLGTAENAGMIEVLATTEEPLIGEIAPVLRLSDTVSQFVIETRRELVVDDTLVHPLLRNIPTVLRLQIMAYIGVPIWQGAAVVGGVAMGYHRRRIWSEDEIEAVWELAEKVERHLETKPPETPEGG